MNRGQLVLFVPLKAWMEELREIVRKFEEEKREADARQKEFYEWTQGLAREQGLRPMTPEEISAITKTRKHRLKAA